MVQRPEQRLKTMLGSLLSEKTVPEVGEGEEGEEGRP